MRKYKLVKFTDFIYTYTCVGEFYNECLPQVQLSVHETEAGGINMQKQRMLKSQIQRLLSNDFLFPSLPYFAANVK